MTDSAAASDLLAAHRATFADALRRGDATAASSVYASNAHLLAPSAGPMVGREEIRAYWQAGIDAGVAELTLTVGSSEQNDGLAYEMGRYAIRVEPADGSRVLERGHYVQVYQRQPDGAWQKAVEIFSPGGSE
jgi:ketosteroid isomerase-like protein